MLEIFALPYFAVSGLIGWIIFAPFFRIEESESLSRANVTISDLLAISLPVSVLFASTRWIVPADVQSPVIQAIVVVGALLFALTALTVGLFLVPKKFQVTFMKRMATVGIIAPLGILLVVGWIGFLIWACTYSMLYLPPSMIALAAATAGLRVLGLWVCQEDTQVIERATNPPN